MFSFYALHSCEILLLDTLMIVLMVVRHDLCLSVISLCHVFGSYYFASMFLLHCTMSHMCLYPVVYISHFWMQDGRLG